ncbi:MAG: carbohydrate ABC transporter substrate-binding protein [Deltaproteobacteria bacterium]|nr:MAG: carbohydrate ABC transporter substrate-binding protein [Deltaproteobacteria bacterium]
MADKASSKGGITRRDFVRMAGVATGMAAVGAGIEDILSSRRAPAFAQERSLHFLLWKNFSPPADVEILRQGEEWGKQSKVNVKIEQINANDLPARAAAAIESKQGPDIIQFFHNWQNQYADALVDVTDICTALESKYGGYIDYAKTHAMLNGRFNAIPHTVVPNIYVVRASYMKAAGTTQWPKTWEELRREGKKWKAKGHPIGQTVGHTFGDAVDFTYPYLWSFGVAERDEKGRVVIASKQALEAMKFFKALWDDAMDPAGAGWDDSSNNRAFLSGAITATNNAPSIYLTASNQVILDEKGVPLVNDILHVPNPAGPAGVFHYHYSQQLAIPNYSKNAEPAKEFLRWLMDKEQLTKYLRRAQAYHAAALKAYLKDAMWDMFPALKPFRDHILEGRHVGWKGSADANAARVVQNYVLIDMLANVATGKMAPEESLKWGEAQLKSIYGG